MIEDFFKSRKEYFDHGCMNNIIEDMVANISYEFKCIAKRYVEYDRRINAVLPPEDTYDMMVSMMGYVPNIYSLECYDLELYTQLVHIVLGYVTKLKEKIKELDIPYEVYNGWKSILPETMRELHVLIRELYVMEDFKRFSIGVSKTIINSKYPVHDVISLEWNDLELLERRFTVAQAFVDMM